MSLRELTEAQEGILALLETLEGEESSDIKEQLADIESDRVKKIESICGLIGFIGEKNAAAKAEVERLDSLINSRACKVEWLKDYLRENMKDGEKLNFDLYSVSIGKPSVKTVYEKARLPQKYIDVVEREPVIKPKTRDITADLKAGIKIEGAYLEDGKKRLFIE